MFARLLGVATLVCVSALSASTLVGCAGETDGASGETSADLTSTLTPEQCKTPNVTTSPLFDASHRPIDGTAKTSLTGCILGRDGEAGTAVLGRAAALLGDTNKLGLITDETGSRVFSSFRPHPATGTLATGLVQDIDVVLNVQFSPSTRIRVTRRQGADGNLSLAITNVTALQATVAFFPVTAVNPGDLTLSASAHAETNGISVAGSGQVTLQVQKDQANQSAALVHQVFDWLTQQLDAS
jgi:hypothetical protein